MRRVPVLSTMVVGLAVAAMIALGLWQLQRRDEKERVLVRLAANVHLPPIPFPAGATGEAQLFRPATLMCRRPLAWQQQGGRAADGTTGWRLIATCETAPKVPGVLVQMGVARAPGATVAWTGGRVAGFIAQAPDSRSLLSGLFDRTPRRLMLVAATPAPGLAANPGPDLSGVPNNHLAYAVQWFLFAGIAVVVYVLALRRRGVG